jgi:gliding motility-associated-like protein
MVGKSETSGKFWNCNPSGIPFKNHPSSSSNIDLKESWNGKKSSIPIKNLLLGDFIDINDTLYLSIADCNARSSVCINLPRRTVVSSYSVFVDNDLLPSDSLRGCDFDTICIYDFQPLDTIISPFNLVKWTINTQDYSGSFNNISELLTLMKTWDPLGKWRLVSSKEIQGGNPNSIYSKMTITGGNGFAEIPVDKVFSPKGTRINFKRGFSKVLFIEKTTLERDSFWVETICVTPSIIRDTLEIGKKKSLCLDFSELGGKADTIIINCNSSLGSSSNTKIDLNTDKSCFEWTANSQGIDTICFLACNKKGICDQTTYILHSNSISTPVGAKIQIFRSIAVDSTGKYCLPNGVGSSLTASCSPNGDAEFTQLADGCIQYKGVTKGNDTACYIVCYPNNPICDTLIIYLTIEDNGMGGNPGLKRFVKREIKQGQKSAWCIPAGFNFVSLRNGCHGNSGQNVNFTLPTGSGERCIEFQGTQIPGQDTACIYLTRATGEVDTFIVCVSVRPFNPQINVVIDTIFRGDTILFCLDTFKFPGIFQGITLTGGNPRNTSYIVNPPCIIITGNTVGTDTLCFTSRDNLGNRDSVKFFITVKDRLGIRETIDVDLCKNQGENSYLLPPYFTNSIGITFSYECKKKPDSLITFVRADSLIVRAIHTLKKDTLCLIGTRTNGIKDTLIYRFNIIDSCVAFVAGESKSVFRSLNAGQVDLFCAPFTSSNGTIISTTTLKTDKDSTNVKFLSAGNCLTFEGLKPGRDSIFIYVKRSNGAVDTCLLIVTVNQGVTPSFKVINRIITLGEIAQFCPDPTTPQGGITGISSNRPDLDTTHVKFSILNNCVDFEGLNLGIDTLDLFLVRADGPDSCRIIVTVIRPALKVITASIALYGNGSFCPDTLNRLGRLVSIDTSKIGFDTSNATFIKRTFCVDYFGKKPGKDSIWVYGNRALGKDTCLFVVTVRPTLISIVPKTGFINDTAIFCLDTTELRNLVYPATLCKAGNGNTTITIQQGKPCFKVEYEKLGLDTVCFVLCDKQGNCDTTYYIFDVKNRIIILPPVAVNDADTTLQATSIVLNLIANDTLNGPLISTSIKTQPLNGLVQLSLTGSIATYAPFSNFCGQTDSFQYVICNDVGCDSAWVTILVQCDQLIFYNAFSPNGDDANKTFIIDGLNRYPNNELIIYNRWGNQIHLSKPYKNDFDGTWEGQNLPDGTYFYMFKPGDGRTFRGYIQLSR